jgi:hypothetical protein
LDNVRVAFDILGDKDKIAPGFQKIKCQMVFDVKMGSLRRKCHLVAGGHDVTGPPATITYGSEDVSGESVRIALTVAALNHDLNIMLGGIKNAYSNSPCEEKIWTILSPEFGSEQEGKQAIIVLRSIYYGLKSAGASYRYQLATCMEHLGFTTSCKADPDVWLQENTDHMGAKFYDKYVLIYTDGILAIGKDPTRREILRGGLNKYFTLKEDSIGEPDIYLGAKLHKVVAPNGQKVWTPMSTTYRPAELVDISPELSVEIGNRYQSASIGVLHWAIEQGRIDIITEISVLASQMALGP